MKRRWCHRVDWRGYEHGVHHTFAGDQYFKWQSCCEITLEQSALPNSEPRLNKRTSTLSDPSASRLRNRLREETCCKAVHFRHLIICSRKKMIKFRQSHAEVFHPAETNSMFYTHNKQQLQRRREREGGGGKKKEKSIARRREVWTFIP